MRTLPLLGALALLVVATPGRAEPWPTDLPRKLKLEYTRAPSAARCPTEQTFRDTVLASMTYDPFEPEAKARLVVKIRRDGGTFKGKVEIFNEEGKVVWSYPVAVSTCYLVTDILGFTVGIALDPLDRRQKAEPPPPPQPPPATPPLPPPPPPAPAVEPSKRKVEFGLGGALALGKVPSVAAFELVVNGTVRQEALSVGLEASFVPPMSIDIPYPKSGDMSDPANVRGSRFTIGLVPCGHVRWFFGCGLLQFSTLISTVTWLDRPPGTEAGFSAGFGGRLGADVPLRGSFGLRFSADLVGLVNGTERQIADVPVWTSSPVAGALGVGVVSTF